MTAKRGRKLLFVVPCFNEQYSARAMVQELSRACPQGDILVIDDGSNDRTWEAVQGLARVIRLPVNCGIGAAHQTGIKYACRHGYALCLQMDGDGQHPPSEIRKFLEAYKKKPVNLLIGSRFLGKEANFRSTLFRRLGIALIRRLVRSLTGQIISDPTSGYRLLDRGAIEVFSEDYSFDYPEPISLAIAKEWDLSVAEIPVKMRERERGRSSISGLKTLAYMVRVAGYLILVRLRGVL